MEREKRPGSIIFAAMVIFLICIVINFCTLIYTTNKYNSKERFTKAGEDGECTVELYPRGGVADSWDKMDVEVAGKIISFTGTTYDCDVKNFSDSKVSDWTMRIDVEKPCYINNSWCGMVEVHQRLPGSDNELVQTIDLRDYDKDDLHVKHFFVSQDLYIPLEVGDYLIYHPSVVSGEYPIASFNGTPGKIEVGFIFYHLRGFDLSFSASMTYKLSKSYLQGTRPKILLFCLAVWVLLFVVRVTFILTTSNLKRENASVIHAISKIYYNLYKTDLQKDSFQEIRACTSVHKFFERFTSASAALKNLPDAMYCHDDMISVREFYNMENWKKMLRDTDSCSADFKAKKNSGKDSRWIRTNLIVCRRDERGVPTEVICGLQDVDEEVREREQNKMMIERFASDLSNEVAEQTLHIQEIQRRVVSRLADMIGSRDGNTGGHVKRTSDIMKILVDEIIKRNWSSDANPKFSAITERVGEDIVRAAPMHDLGKIFIDKNILCKPGKLTEDEYRIMKTHSEHSGEIVNLILRDVEEEAFVDIAFNIARYHHERWDGLGYPEGAAGGKVGEGIPLEARIMAVADVYDALVSKRCYKEPMSFDMACKIMLEGMGKQFDPDMEEIFLACRDELENYYIDASE